MLLQYKRVVLEGNTQDGYRHQPYPPSHTVELFAKGIDGCLVTLVIGIVDKQQISIRNKTISSTSIF